MALLVDTTLKDFYRMGHYSKERRQPVVQGAKPSKSELYFPLCMMAGLKK